MAILETAEIVWHSDGFMPPEPVFSLTFYGNHLLTAGADKTIRLWNIPQFSYNKGSEKINNDGVLTLPSSFEKVTSKINLLACLEGHKTPLSCVRVSPCGNYLASSSSEPFIIIWEKVKNNKEENNSFLPYTFKKKRLLYGHEAEVFSITFLSTHQNTENSKTNENSKNLRSSKRIRRSDMESSHFEEAKEKGKNNSLILVSCSIDNKVVVWNILDGTILQSFKHSSPVKDVCSPITVYLNSNVSLQSREHNKNIDNTETSKQEELKEGNEMYTMKEREEEESSRNPLFQKFDSGFKLKFASYGNDKALYIYTQKQKNSKTFLRKRLDNKRFSSFEIENCSEIECDSFVRRNAFSPDGQFLVQVGMKSSSVNKFKENLDISDRIDNGIPINNNDNKEKKKPKIPLDYLAVIWDIKKEKPILTLKGFKEPVIMATFYPYRIKPKDRSRMSWLGNERYLIALATTRSLILYETTRSVPIFFATNIHCTYITDLAWRKDGLAISSSDGYVSFVKLGIEFFRSLVGEEEEGF